METAEMYLIKKRRFKEDVRSELEMQIICADTIMQYRNKTENVVLHISTADIL
jgi:hypothetical protein